MNTVVRRWFWAFENDTDAFRDTLHPAITWFPIEEDRTPSYGVDAAVRNRNQWLDTWDAHRFELEQLVEEGDSVVVAVHVTARLLSKPRAWGPGLRHGRTSKRHGGSTKHGIAGTWRL